jgi:hypothetical protein
LSPDRKRATLAAMAQTQAAGDRCITCLGAGEIGSDHGPQRCPSCFGEGRLLGSLERTEWRLRDIERTHQTDAHGCAADVRWLVYELRRSREALLRILARCDDETGDAAADIKFTANQVLELYEARKAGA